MQIANTAALDAARLDLLDAFDEVWTGDHSNPWPLRARLAHECAVRLDRANSHDTYERGAGNRIIFPGGTVTAPRVICA